MTIPTLSGTIARRLLVNFRADPAVVQALLPPPFRPQLFQDHAIVGVCLIRLERVRPTWMPAIVGASSENAAHRFAITWDDENGHEQSGVYIPRRDTGSRFNAWSGGRLFPGEHHLARFDVSNTAAGALDFSMRSHDQQLEVRLRGNLSSNWPTSSCFANVEEASDFFREGTRGFSPRLRSPGVDGLRLQTHLWRVEPLEATEVFSSFYADESKFPRGSIEYDHTLFMHDIAHQWHAQPAPTVMA
ncbi:hypothetical protein IAD21_01145 [Abditibacteriota bacterium]|nr:hypothetical protein IAD21_01145 [Abditibacteriota bacterium]